jgi:hypothetical protein
MASVLLVIVQHGVLSQIAWGYDWAEPRAVQANSPAVHASVG